MSFVKNKSGPSSAGASVPSGIPSLDSLLGGGLPAGSLTVLEEDPHGVFSIIFLRCFLSQGLYDGQKTTIFTGEDFSVNNLPAREVSIGIANTTTLQDGPRIAWRYDSTRPVDNTLAEGKSQFDLSSLLTSDKIEKDGLKVENIVTIPISDVKTELTSGTKLEGSSRVVFHYLNNPLSDCGDSLPEILLRIKSWTRNHSNSIVLVTYNPSLVPERIRKRIYNISDAAFQLDWFETPSPAYPDFAGLFVVHKLPKVNSLNVPRKIDTLDLGFQVKKSYRFFEIDRLFLPPEDQEMPSRSTAPCSSIKVDF